jgi:hypothetical protein
MTKKTLNPAKARADAVKSLVAEGVPVTEAIRAVAKERGEAHATVSSSYYRTTQPPVDVARKSRFREGGQANVVEEAAKVLRAVATDLAENREGAPQMFVDATVGALEYKASLLDLVVAELRDGIYT